MNRDRDPGQRYDEPEAEEYDDDRPRSIFAALWFRALLAVLVLGVFAAVVVPYVLDLATHSTSDSAPAKRPASAPASAVTPSTAQPAATSEPATATTRRATVSASSTPSAPASPSAAAVTTPAPSEPPKAAASTPPTAGPAPATPSVAPIKQPATRVDTPRDSPRVVAATRPSAAKTASTGSGSGPYWVQVGAFGDSEAANRLVGQLRQQGFPAEQFAGGKAGPAPAPAADSPGDRYSVVVSGGSPGDVDAKLAAKGMTSETAPGGAVVRPSLPLRDAVALSRELADAGLTVQVRREGGAVASAPARTGETWYRVRVGGFPDRAAAVASLRKLEEKGFKPFIATGTQ